MKNTIKGLRFLPAGILFWLTRLVTRQSNLAIGSNQSIRYKATPRQLKLNSASATRVHLLWVNGSLSKLEKLSLESFVQSGFDVNLWTYAELGPIPEGVTVRSANDVVNETEVFLTKQGSFAPFSDFFRYKVLIKEPGLWSDLDVICLIAEHEFRRFSNEAFLVSERLRVPGSIKVNTNVMFFPDPANLDLLKLALSVSEKFDRGKIRHLELGPLLMTALFQSYPHLQPKLFSPHFANPVNHWECPKKLLDPKGKIPRNAAFLHCFNEIWRRQAVSKDMEFPKGSIMYQLEDRYLGH